MVRPYNDLVDAITFVARLFQQVICNHDIKTLLQPGVDYLVTFLLHHDSIRLVRKTIIRTQLVEIDLMHNDVTW